MKQKLFVLILVLLAPVLLVFFARTINAQTQTKRVIVIFRPEVREANQNDVISGITAKRLKRLTLVNAQVVEATQVKIDALKQDPNVLRVEEDAIAFTLCHRWWHRCVTPTPTSTPTLTPTPTSTPSPTMTPAPTPEATGSAFQPIPWGVDRIDAEKVWPISAANNIKVAVVDTGINLSHTDLKNNIKGGVNTINSKKNSNDDNGHGSHVAGIIAAVNNSVGVVGVGHEIDLYSVKVLGANGSGYVSDIIEGIQWSMNNGMNVVNMSLGTTSDVVAFHDAVIAAKNAGIVVVSAAGNSGPGDNTVIYPAKYEESIAVAATNSSDGQPSWSSRGTEVDIAAPGNYIYSTYKNGTYATLSGTSMSTPHVAGAAAMVLATHPGFTPSQVQAHLQNNAEFIPGLSSNQQGSGLVDVEKAVLTP